MSPKSQTFYFFITEKKVKYAPHRIGTALNFVQYVDFFCRFAADFTADFPLYIKRCEIYCENLQQKLTCSIRNPHHRSLFVPKKICNIWMRFEPLCTHCNLLGIFIWKSTWEQLFIWKSRIEWSFNFSSHRHVA